MIVYLDHFAAIEVSDDPSSNTWVAIRDLLIKLVQNGNLVCPITFETYFELTKSNFTLAKSRCKILHSLSNGLGFKQEMVLLYDIVNAIVRNSELNKNIYLMNPNKLFFQAEEDFEEMKQMRINYEREIIEKENVIERLNRFLRKSSSKSIALDDSVKMQQEVMKINLLARLDEFLTHRERTVRKSNLGTFGHNGQWIDLLINHLFEIKDFKHEDLVVFKNHLFNYGITRIPPLDITSNFNGLRSFNKRNGDTNDQIDIKRISIGLPISDFLLVDKQRKYEIIELGLDKKYNCKVFSGTPKDLELFKEVLQEINDTTYNNRT